MPNWCDNSATFRNSDKSKIDAFVAELEKKDERGVSLAEPFNHLRPNPTGEWQYDWSVEHWGTKWDANIIDWERQDDNTVWMSFDTAWSPPSELYEYLTEEGWELEAIYHEPGMAFIGSYTSEFGDDFYEYDITEVESIEALPEDLAEYGNLWEEHQQWVEENEEDDEEEVD